MTELAQVAQHVSKEMTHETMWEDLKTYLDGQENRVDLPMSKIRAVQTIQGVIQDLEIKKSLKESKDSTETQIKSISDDRSMDHQNYGGYCNKVRSKGQDPIPFHKWQETYSANSINHRFTETKGCKSCADSETKIGKGACRKCYDDRKDEFRNWSKKI